MNKGIGGTLASLFGLFVASLLVGGGVGWLAAWGGRPAGGDGGGGVVVSVPPLIELVRPLLRDGVPVSSVVPAGRTVHGFEPLASDLAALARADAVVFVGLGLEERWGEQVRRGGAPAGRVIVLSELAGAALRDGESLGVDPHLWLDPALMRGLIEALHGALPAALVRSPAEVAGHLARIDAVDAACREGLAPFEGAAIATHHNAFARFGRRYGLRIGAVLVSADTAEPTPARIAEVRRAIEAEGVRVMIAEPQFNDAPARLLAEAAGVRVGVLDPLGPDWFTMMERNLSSLIEGLGTE